MGALANLKVVVGSDTGLMHLAVGGCPTVTAFGPTNADKWGHDYLPHHVVRVYKGQMRSANAEEILEAAISALRGR